MEGMKLFKEECPEHNYAANTIVERAAKQARTLSLRLSHTWAMCPDTILCVGTSGFEFRVKQFVLVRFFRRYTIT